MNQETELPHLHASIKEKLEDFQSADVEPSSYGIVPIHEDKPLL